MTYRPKNLNMLGQKNPNSTTLVLNSNAVVKSNLGFITQVRINSSGHLYIVIWDLGINSVGLSTSLDIFGIIRGLA